MSQNDLFPQNRSCECDSCRVARKIESTTGQPATIEEVASVIRAAEQQGVRLDEVLEHGFATAVAMQNRTTRLDSTTAFEQLISAPVPARPFISMSAPEQYEATRSTTARLGAWADTARAPVDWANMRIIDGVSAAALRQSIIASDAARSAPSFNAAWTLPAIEPMMLDPTAVAAFLEQTGAAPAQAEIKPEPTLYEQRVTTLAERSITPIPDDECTDMGAYVVWNKYDPTCTLTLAAPSSIGNSYDTTEYVVKYGYGVTVEKIEAERRRAHPLKMVRVQGWYKITDQYGEERLMYYYVNSTRDTVQRYYVFTAYSVDRDRINNRIDATKGTFEPASVRDVPKRHRNWLIAVVRERIYNCTTDERVRHVCDNVEASVKARLSAPPGAINRFGNICSEDHYRQAKQAVQQVSSIIRHAADHDAEEIIDALQSLENLGNYKLSNMVPQMIDAWNQREPGGEAIERASCGHFIREGDGHSTRDGEVCDSCFEDNYVYVEDTDDYRNRDNVYRHDDDCYYTYQQQHDDDDDDDDDEDENCGGRIKNYSTDVRGYHKPDPTIKPSLYGDFLMGVELEVVPKGGYRAETAEHTIDNLADDYAILKNDGSLKDGGFEIVTAPRGLAEHIQRFNSWTPHKKLTAWDAECCGLHVHMSSQAFSQATLGKFIEFICAVENDPMIIAIAGRSPSNDIQARQYCRRDPVFPGNAKATLREKASNGERYRMVNTQNMSRDEAARLGLDPDYTNGKAINTVELRIFRASLKKGRLLAQIEFAHAAVMFCRWSSMRELRLEHFLKWLQKSAGSYPHLAKWFGVKANTQVVIAKPEVVSAAEV